MYGKSFIADPYDISEIKEQLLEIIDRYKNGRWPEHSEEVVNHFDRKKLTGKLAKIFDEISTQ